MFGAFLQDESFEEVRRIHAPALIVWGDADALSSRATQEDLLRGIGGSRLVVYQDAGHAVHWEEPTRFAAELAAFTRTLSDRRAAPSAARADHAISPATA